ncbi:AAA family ATPase [Kribbella sp. NPDC048928]|uniref:AAA family ATPase n=1 Tax=Kribbella sp. NPDC048928 TaxID=3364111 RepID=UPI0037164A59
MPSPVGVVTSHQLPTELRGRQSECATLDSLVDRVRAGTSQVLVLRGETGVGKSTLLDYLANGLGQGCRLARAAGVESEVELPFSGLHQLCAPMLDHLDRLPGPQRDALATPHPIYLYGGRSARRGYGTHHRGLLIGRTPQRLGRYQEALKAAEQGAGYPDRAAAALDALVRTTSAGGTDWALGIEARSRAPVSRGDAAEACYLEAVERLGRTRMRVEHARAQLLYGEWLRRENRRRDARLHLRSAYDMFTPIGGGGFRPHGLHKVFAKLGIGSRRELSGTLLNA